MVVVVFLLIYVPVGDGLKVASFNAQSLKSDNMARKRAEIAEYIFDNNIDVMVVTETWFTKGETAKADELAPKGYVTKSFPRLSGQSGGGIAIIYRTSMDSRINLKSSFDFPHTSFQLVKASVTLQHGALHLLCLYRPPPSDRNKLTNAMFVEQLPALMDYVNNLHGHVCFLGDANVHFNSPEEHFPKQVIRVISMFGFNQIVNEKTQKRGNTLDWVVVRDEERALRSCTVTDSLSSDHFCIICIFDVSILKPDPVFKIIRNIRDIDRSSFNHDLTAELSASPSPSFGDAKQFCASLRNVLDKHAPESRRRVIERPSSDWFPLVAEELLEAKRVRRREEDRWRATGLTVFHEIYTKAKHAVSSIVNRAKTMYYNGKIRAATSQKDVFKVTDHLLANSKERHFPTIYPIPELPGIFSNFFAEKIDKIRRDLDSMAIASVPATSPPFTASSFLSFFPVDESCVRDCILSCQPKTCPLDPIPTPLLLECLDSILPSLTALFNSSLTSGVFPDPFKQALVTPLLKKPSLDVNELKNYRPVSNLSFISKILEKLALAQISDYLNSNSLLDPLQSAYRPGHSTETALLKVVNDLLLSIDNRNVSLLTLLDLSAAFDTIDHSILLQRLQHDFGIGQSALQWFSTYLSGRSQSVIVEGNISDSIPLQYGVPQGSVLGPVLFVLYVKPLSSIIDRHSMSHHAYADDTQLHSSSSPQDVQGVVSSTQACVTEIKSWMSVNKLKLNDDKTEVMLVSSSRMSQNFDQPGSMTICDSSIQLSDSVKNLGFFLDNHLEMTTHVRRLAQSANYQLRRIGSIRRFLTKDSATTLVCALILSRMDYCNSLLYNCHDYLLNNLQIIQNSAARMVLRVPRTDHMTQHLISLHWLPIKHRITFKIATLCYKCKNDNNAPQYLKDLIQPKRKTGYNTRSSMDTTSLAVSSGPSQKTLGDRAFANFAPVVWNAIPQNIREAQNIDTFKRNLKTHLFRLAYQ